MVRGATESDLPIIALGMVRLQQLHVDAFPAIYKPFSESDAVSYLAGLLSQSSINIRIAVHAEQIAGHTILAVESVPATMFKHSQRYGHVTQMEVDPKFQRLGLGSLLLADIDAIAARLDLNHILLDVWAFNESAQAFFSEFGYNKFGTKMVRHIPPNGG